MRQPAQRRKPAKVQVTSFMAPTGGLVSNRNLAMARGPDLPPGAAVLRNFFPTATGVILRRGSRRWASIDSEAPVKSLFTYTAGSQREFFAATDAGIWDITTVANPFSYAVVTEDDDYIAADDTGDGVVIGESSLPAVGDYPLVTNGDWSVVQFATAGGTFLVGVNGTDDAFLYDGTAFYPILAGGLTTLDFDAETGAFAEGLTVTGGTSGATGTIVRVISDGTTGTLWLRDVVGGPFDDNEAITDSATGAATANGASELAAPGITFPVGSSLTTADLSYVWVYKQRLYFIERNSLNVWYLPVDQVAGELTLFPMGGIFIRGGNLMWGQTWSLDNGGSGGLSEQCVFTTTEGEVAAYQGLSPDVDQGWTKVGVYRIGKPLGKKAFIRAGGDLVIATSVGFVSLSAASRYDYAALGQNAVSYDIEDDWARAVQLRGQEDWRCEVWADGQMALVSPPFTGSQAPVIFVSNVNTGKWCTVTGWDARSLEVFDGRLFFGTSVGTVLNGWVGGTDDGLPYSAQCLPLFDNLGAPASLKVVKMARAVMRSAYPVSPQLSGQVNYRVNFPPPPSVPPIAVGNEWDNATWDLSVWDAEQGDIVVGDWVSVGGSGHDIAIGAQIASGAIVPLDAEIVRVDLTYTVGEVGT